MLPNIPIPRLEQRVCNGVRLLTDDELFRAAGVRIAFTGRDGGVSAGDYASLNTFGSIGDDEEAVKRNRAIALGAAGIEPELLIVPNQVHSAAVLAVEDGYDAGLVTGQAADGVDALAIEPPHVAALLNSADCLVLILVSPTGRFAVAHAGWRGAVAGIAGKAARALAELDAKDGPAADPAGYNAYIGPHIRVECFEVGPEVQERFEAEFGDGIVSDGHVDLAAAVTRDLVRAGLREPRIADAGICTQCHPDQYFSYRATNGRCGRHAAIACNMRGTRKPR